MADWRNRIIERKVMKVRDVAVNATNPRTHPHDQRERLKAVLDKFGKVADLLAFYDDQNQGKLTLFDGHARQGLDPNQEWEIAVTDLTRAEVNELSLYFDPIAALARPDPARQLDLMQDLGQVGGVLGAFLDELARESGFARGQVKPTVEEELPLIDKAELLQDKWQVQPSQIYQIGPHFIICGDCREPETWQRLLSAAKVDKVNGVFTSPPYAEQRKAQYGGVPVGEYVQWWEAVQGNVREWLAGDGSFFVNIKPHCEDGQRVLYVFDLVLAMVRVWGWRFVDELCWTHPGYPGGWDNRFKNGFESIYHFCYGQSIKFTPDSVLVDSDRAFSYSPSNDIKNKTGSPFGVNGAQIEQGKARPSNVIEANVTGGEAKQAAMFPVALPTFFLKAYSDPGDVWLDCFAGSGTTIAAAHNEGRRGLGIERLEKYCAVILERLQNLTQQDPVLLSE